MNSYYTLRLLIKELQSTLLNARFVESTTPSRQTWVGVFSTVEPDGKERFVQLHFHSSADRISLFFRSIKNEEILQRKKRKNRRCFFEELNGRKIVDIALSAEDRLIRFRFDQGLELMFILFGPTSNCLLFDEQGVCMDSFKRTEVRHRSELPFRFESKPNETAEHTRVEHVHVEDSSAEVVELNQIPEFEKQITSQERVKKWILSENPKLPRPLLKRILLKKSPIWTLYPQILSEKGAHDFAQEMTFWITERPEPRILEGGVCSLVPAAWITHEESVDTTSANEMVRTAFYATPGKYSFEVQKNEQIQKLEGLIKKRMESLRQLADEKKTLERADKNERFGHLLLANAHKKISPDQSVVELEDLYTQDQSNKTVQIAVDPSKNMAQNAQNYYDKSEKGRRSIVSLKVRRKELEEDLESLKSNLERLQSISNRKELDRWTQEVGKEIKSVQPSLPYREIENSGWRIWIGKNSKSNEIMLSLAHKEDIWMHARGVPGSHVILRMNGSRERPPLEILEIAASHAAWYSKARGSSLAPVMFTRKKYVTKPRKSPPGAVFVQKEEVLIVPPVCPS